MVYIFTSSIVFTEVTEEDPASLRDMCLLAHEIDTFLESIRLSIVTEEKLVELENYCTGEFLSLQAMESPCCKQGCGKSLLQGCIFTVFNHGLHPGGLARVRRVNKTLAEPRISFLLSASLHSILPHH